MATLFCADPGELLSFAEKELSKYAILREGLVEGDLFLSLYRYHSYFLVD